MINPTFTSSVTIFHQERTVDEETKRSVIKWIRKVYDNCFFGSHVAESVSGNVVSQASSFIIRIPMSQNPTDIIPGDIAIEGKVFDEITDASGNRASDVLNRYKPRSFTIRTVSDNTKTGMGAHIKLTGV